MWPPPDPPYKDDNDRSLWLGLGQDDSWLWLSGDNGPRVEARLEGFPPGRHVLLAPHHGGKGSTGSQLLERLRPQAVIFSTGCFNSYGMPRADSLQRAAQAGAAIYSTGNDGCLHLSRQDEGWRITPYLDPPRRCTWNFKD
jgi:competence protein ComEC